MIVSLFEYLLNKKVIYIYTVDNTYWTGLVEFVWIDHLVLKTSESPKIIIPFSRINTIREYDAHAIKTDLETVYNKVTEQ